MILDIIESLDGVPIRLTGERWEHIVDFHPYMSGYYDAMLDSIEYPEFILRGQKGAKVAVLNVGRKQWLLTTYKETSRVDGFIITAYIDDEFNTNLIVWRRDN